MSPTMRVDIDSYEGARLCANAGLGSIVDYEGRECTVPREPTGVFVGKPARRHVGQAHPDRPTP
jgi:hypothetical protein